MKRNDDRRPAAPDLAPRLDPGPERLGPGDLVEFAELGPDTGAQDRLAGLQLLECRLERVDLSGRRLDGLVARDVVLVECDLAGATLGTGGRLTRVRFEACRLTGFSLAGAELSDVAIVGGTARMANLRGASARRLWCEGVSLAEADLAEARLDDCSFLDCDLDAVEFRGARATRLALHGSRVEGLRSVAAVAGALEIEADQAAVLGEVLLGQLGTRVAPRPGEPPPRRTATRRASG